MPLANANAEYQSRNSGEAGLRFGQRTKFGINDVDQVDAIVVENERIPASARRLESSREGMVRANFDRG
jgi:hypothetical protein